MTSGSTSSKDMFACKLRVTHGEFGGLSSLIFSYCHKYDWLDTCTDVEPYTNCGTQDHAEDTSSEFPLKSCKPGYFIDSIQGKWEHQ
jgi:hypothetical protein